MPELPLNTENIREWLFVLPAVWADYRSDQIHDMYVCITALCGWVDGAERDRDYWNQRTQDAGNAPCDACTEAEESEALAMSNATKYKSQLDELRHCCRAAIKAGDWIVDGACDPDLEV